MVSRSSLQRALMRVDAKAEGLAVGVGGWAPHYGPGGDIILGKSEWFSISLTEKDAPWAFIKGAPARTISGLEMLATTIGLVLLSPPRLADGTMGSVSVTGMTDSLVSSSVVTRGMTTKYPLCVVSMELAAQLEARGAELLLDWIPREVNAVADRLAIGDTRGFDPTMRVHAEVHQIRWLVLDRLMKAGAAFHRRSVQLAGEAARGKWRQGAGRALKRRKGLRDRDPW